MNYQSPIQDSAVALKDKLTPKAIVAALNEHIVGQDDAEKICRKAMAIASELCVYTNDRLTIESLDSAS